MNNTLLSYWRYDVTYVECLAQGISFSWYIVSTGFWPFLPAYVQRMWQGALTLALMIYLPCPISRALWNLAGQGQGVMSTAPLKFPHQGLMILDFWFFGDKCIKEISTWTDSAWSFIEYPICPTIVSINYFLTSCISYKASKANKCSFPITSKLQWEIFKKDR